MAYVAPLSSDVTQPPRMPPWIALSGVQVTKINPLSTRQKKITHFWPLSCQNFDTWPLPRAAHGGVHGATVVRRHPVATYATLDFSEWRPSHQHKSVFHTIKHRENNEGLRHFWATFHEKFHHLTVYNRAKVKKKSNRRHSRAPPNSENAAPNSTNVKTGAEELCTAIVRNHGDEFRKRDRQLHLRSNIRREAGPCFSTFEAP